MFDEKSYLTGKNGLVIAGEEFRIWDAGIAGEVNTPNGRKSEAYLVITTSEHKDQTRVHTTGAAIVGQVQRMSQADRAAMQSGGMLVVLGTRDTGQSSPAFILEPVNVTEF